MQKNDNEVKGASVAPHAVNTSHFASSATGRPVACSLSSEKKKRNPG
jgi:hypothetical protein